jgi:hypothetical protein
LSDDKITAKVEGARELAARASAISGILDNELTRSAQQLGVDAELIYQRHAPRRSGRLARGIRAVALGDQVFVSAVAVDPKSQYDYVGVTRFGHRKRVIVPVTKRGLPRKARTVRRTKTGQFAERGRGHLVFQSLGRWWFLSHVRGFRPKTDWVQDAWPEVKMLADAEMEKLAREITVTWG